MNTLPKRPREQLDAIAAQLAPDANSDARSGLGTMYGQLAELVSLAKKPPASQ